MKDSDKILKFFEKLTEGTERVARLLLLGQAISLIFYIYLLSRNPELAGVVFTLSVAILIISVINFLSISLTVNLSTWLLIKRHEDMKHD